ncbi:MAG: nuclear transport factor 2 family protein [Balneola sp.]|nr:nuclear transport factor 2 family protein [Balneola sp.]MBO6652028.1 nuclear transport factor 2 family protein [Balneola sp.]MBO6711056.1 nuclear transport factor 2 family protein [Balneola sp.]MBO6800830.1 nuclear transport factor 2 family protein [Balneola sp.]MBO6868991.1 nuclear transport factor 2 family protein [Balneola sp.]
MKNTVNKFTAGIFVMSLLLSYTVNAQKTDREMILSQIETLFDGMRAGDSSAVSKVFSSDATMQSISKDREGNTRISQGSLSGFKNAVGIPRNDMLDERVGKIQINIDENLATAWVPYSLYVGDNFSHCGVNSFQFAKTGEGWKVISIVDTRRRTECVEEL